MKRRTYFYEANQISYTQTYTQTDPLRAHCMRSFSFSFHNRMLQRSGRKRLLDQEYNCFRRNFFRHSIFFASRDFTAVTQSGETVDQTLFAQADVTMINVWTTFCTYCLDEMPALQSLSEEYKDEGFQVVGIVSDVAKSDDETVQNIIDATGTEYMHIIPSSDLRTGFLKNVQSVPTTFFVDSNGKQIGDPYLGAKDQDAWAKIIEEMLRTVQENNKAGE